MDSWTEFSYAKKRSPRGFTAARGTLLPSVACTLLLSETFGEEGGEIRQLRLLRDVDIQLFFLQPVVGVDGDVAMPVGVDDEGVCGYLFR